MGEKKLDVDAVEIHRVALTGFSGSADEQLHADGCAVMVEYVRGIARWLVQIDLPTGGRVTLTAPPTAVVTSLPNEGGAIDDMYEALRRNEDPWAWTRRPTCRFCGQTHLGPCGPAPEVGR